MELIEDSLEVALDDFLARRLFCFLAQRSGSGPRLSPLWFLWEDGTVWNVARPEERSYPDRSRSCHRRLDRVHTCDPAEHGTVHGSGRTVRSHAPRTLSSQLTTTRPRRSRRYSFVRRH